MTIMANILVIDDEESIRIGCMQALQEKGYRVQIAQNGRQGLVMAGRESFDLILLDLKMPGIGGMEVMEKIKENSPGSLVIIITGYATVDKAVEAMKKGAHDFISKPFTPERLDTVVSQAVNYRRITLEKTCLQMALDDQMIADTIVGRSQGIKTVGMLIKKVAPSDSTVLITGETGVGKELVARTIHRLSRRNLRPFITVDCGVLVETLFESEMFGHVKGSFTGAVETTKGKFELADGGTIFLDEIANISINMQSRLLRIIQEREVYKVGSQEKIEVDVRIIAATNKNLLEQIACGNFREDLYYRLNVVPIKIPPLRERREDIAELAEHFMAKFAMEKEKADIWLSPQAMELLVGYDWPGNVRELSNAIECAVVTCEGQEIIPADFLLKGLHPQPPELAANIGGTLAENERQQIIKALLLFSSHKSKAAEYLGINRKTLREKMRKYDID